MNWIATETGVRIVGGLAFLFILYSVWMGQMSAKGLPDGYTNPVLALELVKRGADIEQIFEAKAANECDVREFLTTSTHKDFGYILVYAIFFVALGLLLSRMNFSWAGWVGWLAATCAVVAAVQDVIEDLGMLKAINGQASNALANSIRYPSLAKWSFLFVFSLLVGLLLIARRDLFVIPAVCFLLAALLGLIGVISNLLQPKFYPVFPAALGLMGLGVVILSVAFIFAPEKLLTKFPPLAS
jgi:hypothetical protein